MSLLRGGDDGGGVQPAGLAGQPLDRPGDRHRGDHPAGRPAHRAPTPTRRPARARRRSAPSRGGGRRPGSVAVNLAPCRPRCSRSGSSQASRTCAAEPAFIGSVAPTGTVSRSPLGRSAAATQTRCVALAAVELGALAGVVAQLRRAPGRRRPAAGPRRPRRPARPAAGRGRSGPACRGRPGGGAPARRPAGGRWGGPGRWPATSSARVAGPASSALEHEDGLVQYADSARVVHASILPSQSCEMQVQVRRRRCSERAADATGEVERWAAHWRRRSGTRTSCAERRGRARPALHRPAPRARGDQPAGVRRAAAGRPPGPPPRPDDRHRGPQRPDADIARRRSPTRCRAPRSRRCAATAPSSASGCTRWATPSQGIVHVIGPQLGPDPAGHDDRLRRLPHLHARRVRRAGLRHRHQRGRARAGHPDAAAEAGRDDGGHRRRRAARRASPPRTSSWRSSPRSAPAAARATSSSTAARPSARCRWRAG